MKHSNLKHVLHAIDSLHIEQGDITKYKCDAILCPDGKSLNGTGGVAKAIHTAAGPFFKVITNKNNECAVGEIKVTSGFNLPVKRIIHTVSPSWNNGLDFEEFHLTKCYDSAMRYVDEHNFKSLVTPSIGTGYHNFPTKRAAEIAIHTILYHLQNNSDLEVTIVCSNAETWETYKTVFKKEIIRYFLEFYSPEAYIYNQFSYDSSEYMEPYFFWMIKLKNLETNEFDYSDYLSVIGFDKISNSKLKSEQYYYYLSTKCSAWDYRTCLAYITFLQRIDHWSSIPSYTHTIQCKMGGVRKVLLRMNELLSCE